MAGYLVLGMGSPSDIGEFERKYDSLGGMTPADFARSEGVKVLKEPARLSCHNTPERPAPFAADLEAIAEGGDEDGRNKVVAVLGGGLSLQLPAIVAAHTQTVPVIGVPFYSSSTLGGGLDALTACANLPGGRAIIASAPIHMKDNPSLDRAVRMAVFMLKRQECHKTALVYDDELEEKGAAAYQSLVRLGMDSSDIHRIDWSGNKGWVGLALHVTDDEGSIYDCDRSFYLSVQTVLPGRDAGVEQRFQQFVDVALELGNTGRTLYVARPVNAAEFVGRVIGLGDMKVRAGLKGLFGEKLKVTEPEGGSPPKYDENYVHITTGSFD